MRWIVAIAACLAADMAAASVLASDSIACNGSTLTNTGCGEGWAGNWIGDPAKAGVFVPQGSSLRGPAPIGAEGRALHYFGNLTTQGVGARIYRQVDTGPGSAAVAAGLVEAHTAMYFGTQTGFGVPGTTLWLGYLFNGGTAGNSTAGVQYLAQIHLYDGLDTSNSALVANDNNKNGEVVAIGRGNGNYQWNIERTCAHSNCGGQTSSLGYVSTLAMDSQTHWVVLKFVFTSASSTSINLWLDPTPGAVDPTAASALTLSGQTTIAVPALHFNWVEFGGETASFALDEVRIATSFADLGSGGSEVGCDEIFPDAFE